MPDEKEPTPSKLASTPDELALELMRFIATTTGIGKSGTGAGFGGKAPKTSDEQVDALLSLFEKCRAAVKRS